MRATDEKLEGPANEVEGLGPDSDGVRTHPRDEPRRYRCDDRGTGHTDDADLLVQLGGNDDWYISIVPHGGVIGPTVRITTSGAPYGQPYACVGVAQLWDLLGGNDLRESLLGRLRTALRRDGFADSPTKLIELAIERLAAAKEPRR